MDDEQREVLLRAAEISAQRGNAAGRMWTRRTTREAGASQREVDAARRAAARVSAAEERVAGIVEVRRRREPLHAPRPDTPIGIVVGGRRPLEVRVSRRVDDRHVVLDLDAALPVGTRLPLRWEAGGEARRSEAEVVPNPADDGVLVRVDQVRVDDRRRAPRVDMRGGRCRVHPQNTALVYDLALDDVSIVGCAFEADEPFPRGAYLDVALTAPSGAATGQLEARIVGCEAQDDGRWRVRCAFTSSLAALAVQRLLAAG